MKGHKHILWRVYFICFMMIVVAFLIVGRLFVLQYIEGEQWVEASEQKVMKLVEVEAVRGNIYDINGNLLATSVPKYEVRWDPSVPSLHDTIFNKHVNALSDSLARVFPYKSRFEWKSKLVNAKNGTSKYCLLYTSPSPRDRTRSRMPSSA